MAEYFLRFPPCHPILIIDLAGGVTASNTLVIARTGADTINNGTTVTISAAFGAYYLVSDGLHAWNAQSMGGGISVTLVNAQNGTSYAIQDGDRAKLITASNSAAQAYSIAQAGAASAFQAGWYVDIHNTSTNPAGIVTVTPATSTVDGASTLKVFPGQSVRIVSDGTNYQTVNRQLSNATLQANPSDPTGTANTTTGLMMGLGATCSITPVYSGRVRFEIIGNLTNTLAGGGTQPELVFGTGAAPTNGAAATGTVLGKRVNFNPASAANNAPFNLSGIATGLTAGTPLWFDINLVVGAGTGLIASLSCNAMEF